MVANFETQPLKIDRSQALAHLKALGYQDGDTVYLRFFFPEGDPRKRDDKGRKLEGKLSNLPWSQMEQLQAECRGCYFVVNGGGHLDKDVSHGLAIFYEHDNLGKDLQRDLWQTLGLPEPTVQVDTGGKSIHSKWKLSTPCTPEQWRELQTDLLEFADADRKLKNPSRVMRLAGAYHIKPGREPIQSQLILNTGKTYSYEELRATIPRQQKQETQPSQARWYEFEQNFRLPIDDAVPLYECVSRTDRDLVDRGTGEGARNSNGFALAANLIATSDYLACLGQNYEGDPRQLFEQYAQNCTPPIDSSEMESIWKSASQRTKGTSLSPDAIESCIKSWQWRQIRGENQRPITPKGDDGNNSLYGDRTSKIINHPTAKRQPLITDGDLEERVDELISQNLKPSKLITKLSLLAKETGFQAAEIKRIYYERVQEKDLAESRPEYIAEINDLLKIGSSSLKLAEELPAIYAQPLVKLAQHLSLREEVYLLALLSALSVCHRSGTRLIIHRGQGFSVPLNLFGGIVSESGQRKSPVIKAIITTALRVLQREAKAEHQAAIAKYQGDLEHWNGLDKEGREADFPNGIPQEPPRQKIYFFTSTSGSESINRQIDAHPDQPLLYLKDELMGVFTQQGKYSQGRGSEKQDFLSYFDGIGSTELLADGVRSDTEIILMSIFGSVQPEVLRKFTKDCSDPDGQWARFLWVNQPLAAATLHDDDGGSVDITELLAGLYRQTCALPVMEYTLSRDAFKLYQKAYNRIEQLRINCPDPGMRAVYSKITGQLGRLVGNCHVIHELASEREPAAEIPVERVRQGIRLINFFIEQTKIIRSEGNAAQGDLPDVLTKIIRLSQRLGRIKAKQVQKNYESIKLSPDQIRDTFLELQTMGYGPTYGKKNRMEWEYRPQTDPPDRKTEGEGNDGGGFPEKYNLSPTAPISPTGNENHDWASVSAVGTSPTESPTAPTVLLTPSLEQDNYSAVWISVEGENGASHQTVGETVGAVGETVGTPPTAGSTKTQGFQETVGEIGAVGVFSEKLSQKDNCISDSEEVDLSPTAPTVSPTALTDNSKNNYQQPVPPAVGAILPTPADPRIDLPVDLSRPKVDPPSTAKSLTATTFQSKVDGSNAKK